MALGKGLCAKVLEGTKHAGGGWRGDPYWAVPRSSSGPRETAEPAALPGGADAGGALHGGGGAEGALPGGGPKGALPGGGPGGGGGGALAGVGDGAFALPGGDGGTMALATEEFGTTASLARGQSHPKCQR